MPIENEFKYVLRDPNGRLQASLLSSHRWLKIEQFYVGNGQARFREINDWTGRSRFMFTFKQPVDGKLLEIETEIDQADYELARKVATSTIRKTRFQFEDGETRWDIDFLYDATEDGETPRAYFAMAEAELADGATEHAMLKILEPFVLYNVPKVENVKFTNERLSSPDYAREMMRWIESCRT